MTTPPVTAWSDFPGSRHETELAVAHEGTVVPGRGSLTLPVLGGNESTAAHPDKGPRPGSVVG